MKSIKKAREKASPATTIPGIDSEVANKKLRQYLITASGSEKIREMKGPKLDSANMCFAPIKAKMERAKNIANSITKNFRYFWTRINSFSSPKRFIMREKRPLGGLIGLILSKDSSLFCIGLYW